MSVADNAGLGKILVDGQGRTLYRFNKDSAWPMKFACNDACLDTWKPAKPVDKSKVRDIPEKLVSTVTRPDGTEQLAIDCWPVYWFTGDSKAGDVNGQGKQGLWFAVDDKGKKITTTPAVLIPARLSTCRGGPVTERRSNKSSQDVSDGRSPLSPPSGMPVMPHALHGCVSIYVPRRRRTPRMCYSIL
ncbi:hypothetical protein GCM10020000_02550 [Streptomyces olivoverticillatus]